MNDDGNGSGASSSGSPLGVASLSTVERHHEENKRAHQKFEERMNEHEVDRARINERLAHIDETLRRIASRVEAPRWWILLSALAPLLLIVLAWSWQAARYPDRGDFQSLSARLFQVEIEAKVQRALLDAGVRRSVAQ